MSEPLFKLRGHYVSMSEALIKLRGHYVSTSEPLFKLRGHYVSFSEPLFKLRGHYVSMSEALFKLRGHYVSMSEPLFKPKALPALKKMGVVPFPKGAAVSVDGPWLSNSPDFVSASGAVEVKSRVLRNKDIHFVNAQPCDTPVEGKPALQRTSAEGCYMQVFLCCPNLQFWKTKY